MTKLGSQTSWQYILEDSSESPPTSVRFRLPGMITNANDEPRFNLKEIRGFKQPGDTDQRRTDDIRPSKNEYPFSLTYIPMKRSNTPKYDFRHFHNAALNNTSSTADGSAQTYGTSLTTNLRSFTIFHEIDNLQHQIKGCKINRLTMRGSLDNPLEIQVEGHGSNATFADLSRTDATTLRDGTPFMWSDVTVYLPDAVKRKLVIDPKLSEKEAFDGVSLDAVLDYNLKTERELLKVFLHAASDWDKTTTSQEDYIDNEIPEDVAKEIVLRAQRILASSETSPDEKKTST